MQREMDSIVLSVQFLLNKSKTIQPALSSVIVTTKNAGFLQIVKTIVRIFSRQIDFKDFWGRTYFMCGPNFLFLQKVFNLIKLENNPTVCGYK